MVSNFHRLLLRLFAQRESVSSTEKAPLAKGVIVPRWGEEHLAPEQMSPIEQEAFCWIYQLLSYLKSPLSSFRIHR